MFDAFRPLRLRSAIDENTSMDPDDTLITKTALRDLGYLRLPDYGLTPYPDRAMIDGLKAFQRTHGLVPDGVMKPDGPTVRKLDVALRERTKTAAKRAPAIRRRSGTVDGTRVAQAIAPPGAAPMTPGAAGRLGHGGRPGAGGLPLGYRYRAPDVDWAAVWSRLPEEVQSRLLQAGSFPLATRAFLEEMRTDGEGGHASPTPASVPARTQVADPPPPVPATEPPPDDDKPPDRTELPPAGTVPSPEGRPAPDDELRRPIGGYPSDHGDLLLEYIVQENSRGDDDTKADNRFIVKAMADCLDWLKLNWKHEHGSHTVAGEYKAERLLKAIKHIKKGARPDMTWKIKDGSPKPFTADAQTYTTWKDGNTPVAHERRAMKRIVALKHEHKERGSVGGFPKSRGVNREAWEREMTDAVWDYCIATFGHLSRKLKDLDSLQRASRKKGVRVPPKMIEREQR